MIGAAVIAAALSDLGPSGLMRGNISLGIITLTLESIAEYGFNQIISAVVKELYMRLEIFFSKINKHPISNS